MTFTVERRSEICKQSNDRPGCCWYLSGQAAAGTCATILKNQHARTATAAIQTALMMYMR